MTWEVRGGFNRGLGAVGTLAVWPQKGGGGKECVWVFFGWVMGGGMSL